MSILEGSLASKVAAALEAAHVPRDLTLTRIVAGESEPSTPWIPGAPTITTHPGRGWTESYDDTTVDGTLVDAKDVKVLVLASTIDIEPQDVTDSVTIGGETLTVVNVKRDASGALFILQARA